MSFVPTTVNLTGNDAIPQGTDYIRTFTVLNSGGSPVNLQSLGYTTVRCQFRDKPITNGGATSNCPQPTMSFISSGSGGQIQMHVPSGQSDEPGHPDVLFAGVYDIEIVTSGGLVDRPIQGAWEMTPEVTAT